MSSPSTPPEGPPQTALATASRNGQSLLPVVRGRALTMLADPRSPAAEAYRSLAANLQFSSADRQLQTVGVTSAAAGELYKTFLGMKANADEGDPILADARKRARALGISGY